MDTRQRNLILVLTFFLLTVVAAVVTFTLLDQPQRYNNQGDLTEAPNAPLPSRP